MPLVSLTRFAWLSIFAALLTIGLKAGAYFLTGSVGLLSDALESMVNLVAAIVALIVINIAFQPPDEEHQYGHGKTEYFSSGFEGALILVAAVAIIGTSVHRLFNLQAIEQVGIGVVISVGASLVNLFVAQILLRAGRQYNSITLEADSRHLMTDVWTSVGVVVGVGAVALTGWRTPKKLHPHNKHAQIRPVPSGRILSAGNWCGRMRLVRGDPQLRLLLFLEYLIEFILGKFRIAERCAKKDTVVVIIEPE